MATMKGHILNSARHAKREGYDEAEAVRIFGCFKEQRHTDAFVAEYRRFQPKRKK